MYYVFCYILILLGLICIMYILARVQFFLFNKKTETKKLSDLEERLGNLENQLDNLKIEKDWK